MQEVLFIYKSVESDRFLDSIHLFLPNTFAEDARIALCSQLIGVYEFCGDLASTNDDGDGEEIIRTIIMDDNSRFAFTECDSYIMVLSTKDESASLMLSNIISMFTLYHCGFSRLFDQVCKKNSEVFRRMLVDVFTTYWKILGRGNDQISRCFNSMPAISQKKCSHIVYSKIALLLDKINSDIMGSMISYKNRILISKFKTILSYCFLVNKNQLNFPCHRINPDYELPSSVRLYMVWLSKDINITQDHTTKCDSSSLNIDSGLDTSLPSNNTKTTGGRQEFLLITVSCSNIKYSAILKKDKLHKEALILRLWQILLKSLSEIDIVLQNNHISRINEKDDISDDYLLFNKLSNELSGHMTISNNKEDKEMFLESIDLHRQLNENGNHSEIEISNSNFKINAKKKKVPTVFVFKKIDS